MALSRQDMFGPATDGPTHAKMMKEKQKEEQQLIEKRDKKTILQERLARARQAKKMKAIKKSLNKSFSEPEKVVEPKEKNKPTE